MQPSLASVRPRFVSKGTGDSLVLEETVRDAFQHCSSGIIEITGPAGSGKTSAVLHLLAVLSAERDVGLMDRSELSETSGVQRRIIVEVNLHAPPLTNRIARFELAPWGIDEFIEYALAVHPQQHQSIIARLLAAKDRSLLDGSAELSTRVIDRMAENSGITTIAEALRAEIYRLTDSDITKLPPPNVLVGVDALSSYKKYARNVPDELARLFRHAAARVVACAMQIAAGLNNSCVSGIPAGTNLQNFNELIELTARLMEPDGVSFLAKALNSRKYSSRHSVLASLLFQCDPTWRPGSPRLDLSGALLPRADWNAIDLRRYSLDAADLHGAQMKNARLNAATCVGTQFEGASLRNALLVRIQAATADFRNCDLRGTNASLGKFELAKLRKANAATARFSHSDLRRADLTEAIFRDANLSGANLTAATLQFTDLSNADLSDATLVSINLSDARIDGANFEGAVLSHSCLEGLRIADARFAGCRLCHAAMTGSSFPRADFGRADLTGAYLAEIDWPGADLRNADLRGCTFHMGSSRSGLVHSDIASEGTRTGFYTSDNDDHLYRRPEDIRVANLSGCNLRGADIEGVDFFRVDLRGARCDQHQRDQFVATGAILE
ncbi:MAG: pentapeptide repeat-containing protein [Planctomycetaceae bacterium]